MRSERLFLVLGTLLVPALASAAPDLVSESGFLYDFQGTAQVTLSNGTRDAYDGCYRLSVDGTTYNASGQAYEDAYDGRGFASAERSVGGLAVRRWGFVPEHGLSFARYIDTFRNDSADTVTVTASYYCNLGSDGNETIDSSDGDGQMEITDDWVTTDDADGAGDPSLAHVLAMAGADVGLATLEYGRGTIDWSYDLEVAPGETVAILLFAVQENNRQLAREAAVTLAGLGGEALDAIGEEADHVVNFPLGPAGAPRVHVNGPYRIDEGGSIRLDVEPYDEEGEQVTWSWDLDGDGLYGELPNVQDPLIDASDVDGPATIRVGLQMTDGHTTVERTISVQVANLPPAIDSTPPTSATTGELYEYAISASDFPEDEIEFELADGPAGMTVSPEGLVHWRPAADGAGPTVAVRVTVRDDDGGTVQHEWNISMAGGPIVLTNEPYRVAEGGTVLLAPTVSDPENDSVGYAWDLDGDGQFDDGSDATATWSAEGVDGPGSAQVGLTVTDGHFLTTVYIPVTVQNAPPTFASEPPAIAVVGREWSYTVTVVDPGGDPFTISVDEDTLPSGMTWDAAAATLRWTPTERNRFDGEPEGSFAFSIAAEDEDRGRSRQDVVVTIGDNAPPPVPDVRYPDGETPVTTTQPTIMLGNVRDPDGDPVTYFAEVDHDPCFCSSEVQSSGPLAQGELATEWRLPFPLNVDLAAGGHNRFYVRRWASDGLSDSAKELALFDVVVSDAPDPDADAGPGADGGDESDGHPTAGCACRAGASTGTDVGSFGLLALLALVGWRRSRRTRGQD